MSDNIRRVDEPAGVPVATDEVTRNATVEHQQIVKIGLGAEGAHDTVVDSGQQTMANSVPVTMASDQSNIDINIAASDVSIGGGTEYTEGDTDATITGGAVLAEGPADTLTPLQVDASKHLQVDIAADSVGIGGGTQFDDGDTIDTNSQGTLMIATTGVSGTARAVRCENDGAIHVADGGDSITIDNADITTIAGAVSGSEMQVDIVADGAGLATAANQLPDGHNVTIDNGAGAAAVNIQDGGNTISVDGTVTANAGSGTFTVTDDGSFTLAANSGVDIGDVDVLTLPDVTQSTASNLNAQVVGEVAHDSADSGNPLKVGGVAEDYDTTPEGSDPGATEVADGDRVQLSLDQAGRIVERPIASYHDLDNISTTYNNTTTTATSQAVDAEKYRSGCLFFDITESGTATTIRFILEVSADGTNYHDYMFGPWVSLTYDDTTIADASTLSEAVPFDVNWQSMKVRVDTVGTGASDTFTVTNARIYLRN